MNAPRLFGLTSGPLCPARRGGGGGDFVAFTLTYLPCPFHPVWPSATLLTVHRDHTLDNCLAAIGNTVVHVWDSVVHAHHDTRANIPRATWRQLRRSRLSTRMQPIRPRDYFSLIKKTVFYTQITYKAGYAIKCYTFSMNVLNLKEIKTGFPYSLPCLKKIYLSNSTLFPLSKVRCEP